MCVPVKLLESLLASGFIRQVGLEINLVGVVGVYPGLGTCCHDFMFTSLTSFSYHKSMYSPLVVILTGIFGVYFTF